MTRIGLIGANGQVGAELALMLARRSDIELVPICRTRSGSAFLRWQGIACRHGSISDPSEAGRLIGDCDLIVNSALATGSPADIRRTEDRIIQNIFAYSKPAATIIHFSTQSVYGDPRPGRLVRWRNPYGRAKLLSERTVRRAQRRYGKPCFILRLGHVCGTMQEISHSIRESIRAHAVVLPEHDCTSNTVYTAAIVGAIEQIRRSPPRPGTYDLMNVPRWTWTEVYEYEASACGGPLEATRVANPAAARSLVERLSSLPRAIAARLVRVVLADTARKGLAYLPRRLNARVMAWWYARRAREQIAALARFPSVPEHLSWVANGVRFFPAKRSTRELLALEAENSSARTRPAWPADLPGAIATPASLSEPKHTERRTELL